MTFLRFRLNACFITEALHNNPRSQGKHSIHSFTIVGIANMQCGAG